MSEQRYWGIYFPEDNAWLRRADGELYFYPSPHIALAHKRMHMADVVTWLGGDPDKTIVVKEFAPEEKAMSAA